MEQYLFFIIFHEKVKNLTLCHLYVNNMMFDFVDLVNDFQLWLFHTVNSIT